MWQKQLKVLKKQALTQSEPTIKIDNSSEPDVNFEKYCANLSVQKIINDTVILDKIKTNPHSNKNTSQITNMGIDFIDTGEIAKEFFRFGQKNLPRELRSGKLIINKTIDIHNMTREHSLDLIERLLSSTQNGAVIRIIHGVGLNSEFNKPVLMGTIRKYLQHSSQVLAYSYGSNEQGGNGVTIIKIRS